MVDILRQLVSEGHGRDWVKMPQSGNCLISEGGRRVNGMISLEIGEMERGGCNFFE